MSTTTIEVTPVAELEELLERGAPPCDAYADGLACGLPSVARVTVICTACGTTRCFLCSRCLFHLEYGLAKCLHCQGSRLGWAMT